MDQAEASGKTVEDARNKALAKLGARLDEVEFTVLDEGKRGGLFGRGAQDAVVRVVRLAPQDPESATGGPPDTRMPRQGGGGGQRRDGGGRQRQGGQGGQGAGQRSGGSGARQPRDGGRAGFEQPQPKLTDADFARATRPATAERPPRDNGTSAGGGDRGRGRGPRSDSAQGAPRPPRPARPPRERSSRDNEPPIAPDINAPEVDAGAQIVDDLLRIFDIDAEISIREPLTPGDGLGSVLAVLDIKGEDLGLLIGRRGDTLIAMQYLVNLILGRKYPGRGGVTIDVEHYKHRNEERIIAMATRMGDRVRESGNAITLEPMSAAERRLIHMTFAEDPELETNSIGEGENRKVVISLRQ
ncbi:MAG: Jag N-terminal domain-containing protein [Dehalococcoidia bacterium]|nr:Jag N-terminal domain-containing protein [Dehalococcoidia bacterium]